MPLDDVTFCISSARYFFYPCIDSGKLAVATGMQSYLAIAFAHTTNDVDIVVTYKELPNCRSSPRCGSYGDPKVMFKLARMYGYRRLRAGLCCCGVFRSSANTRPPSSRITFLIDSHLFP